MALVPSSPFQSATKSVLPSAGTGSTIESRLSALEKVIQVAADGSVLIKGATSMKIEAGTLRVKVTSSMEVEASTNLGFKSGVSLDLRSGAAMSIRGAVISINGGTLPVARVGDGVVNGRISDGSFTLKA